MSAGYQKLYEAQRIEHEKTHTRMRYLEKENVNLREIIGTQNSDYKYAVDQLHNIVDVILNAFPKD